MGVSCSVGNSMGCDRFGLAVWLKRPALAVQAEVHGRTFALNDRGWSGPVRGHGRKLLAGFLHPAGLRTDFHLPQTWEGQDAPRPLVRLSIDYGGGHRVRTQTRVTLRPGWG
jgi:hypothetical protein